MTSHLSGYSWSEFTAHNKPWSQGYQFFASTMYLLVLGAVVSCIMWWNLRQ